jgi:hypothetical protein
LGRSEEGSRNWPDNIEAQSKVIAAILRHLLQGGVARTDLTANQFLTDIREAGYPEPIDSDGLFDDIMLWLRDEGVIRIGDIVGDGEGGSYFVSCVISGYGMRLLQNKTDVLGGKSAAEVIMEPVDKNASASQLVKLGGLIGGVIGGFVKSAS